MSDILPVSTGIGFNNGNGFGADTMGAFAGALFGSWFGDAWGGNWSNRGVVGDAAAATGFSTQILNDGINAIQNSVNNMNMNLSSGLCNISYQNLDQNSRTNIAMLHLPTRNKYLLFVKKAYNSLVSKMREFSYVKSG